jgi:hypothetical protein
MILPEQLTEKIPNRLLSVSMRLGAHPRVERPVVECITERFEPMFDAARKCARAALTKLPSAGHRRQTVGARNSLRFQLRIGHEHDGPPIEFAVSGFFTALVPVEYAFANFDRCTQRLCQIEDEAHVLTC